MACGKLKTEVVKKIVIVAILAIFIQKDLVVKQSEVLESTLWVALRIMKERRTNLQKMEDDNIKKGFTRLAKSYKENGEEIEVHVNNLKLPNCNVKQMPKS